MSAARFHNCFFFACRVDPQRPELDDIEGLRHGCALSALHCDALRCAALHGLLRERQSELFHSTVIVRLACSVRFLHA